VQNKKLTLRLRVRSAVIYTICTTCGLAGEQVIVNWRRLGLRQAILLLIHHGAFYVTYIPIAFLLGLTVFVRLFGPDRMGSFVPGKGSHE